MSLPQQRADTWARGGAVVLILSLLVVAAFGFRTISNSDFWQHLAGGRAVAQHGIPRADSGSFAVTSAWVNPSWLYDVFLYGLWSLGRAPLVILVHLAAAVFAFLALVPPTRKWAGGAAMAFALLLSAWLLAPLQTVSPHVIGMLFAGLFVLVLSSPPLALEGRAGGRTVVHTAFFVLLQVLWSNMSPSFMLGPVLVLLFGVEALLRERARVGGAELAPDGKRQVAAAGVLLGITLLATLVNPYGPALHLHLARASGHVAHTYVQEWVSVFSGLFSRALYVKHLVTVVLLIGAGGLIAERRKLPFAITAMAVCSAVLAVRSLRQVELLALLAFPFISLSLSAMGRYVEGSLQGILKDRMHALASGGSILLALAALATLGAVFTNRYYVAVGSASSFGVGVSEDLHPSAAAGVIARADFPARAVNLPWDGGFLAWRFPERQIFVDQRAELYGAEILETLGRCLFANQAEGRAAWAKLEDRYEPGAVILNCCVPGAGSFLRSLLITGRWVLAYFDGATAILVRTVSGNEALASDRAIQEAGLKLIEQARRDYARRLGGKILPAVPARLVGAANAFMALGRYEEAGVVYGLLARGTPSMTDAWVRLGHCRLETGKINEAVAALRTAVRRTPRNLAAWKFLYDATTQAGLPDEAAWARDQALRLRPDVEALFSQQAPAAPADVEAP